VWVERTGHGRTVPLLGLPAASVMRCLGRPPRVRRSGGAQRWSYTGVAFTLRAGRVTAFALTSDRVRSVPDGAIVGAPLSGFRAALGRVVRDGRSWRAIVRSGSRYADVRVAMRRGLVHRVTVTLRSAHELDRAGRALAREHGGAAPAVVRQAEALVDVSPAALGYRLRVTGPRPGLLAETDTGTRTITLHVGAAAVPHRVAHDLAHELGHAIDDRRMSAAARAAYLRARGAPDAPWWPANAAADYRTGAGDFAEVFALCHAASPEFRSRLAARPRDACAALPRAARAPLAPGGGS
jgi:hypothetical protein